MPLSSEPLVGRVLVVDDEAMIAETLTRVVRGMGYEADTCAGFEDVQRALSMQRYDLMTLDIMMPGADGLTVLKWVREHHAEMGVLMATALGDADNVIEAMRLGASDYIVKPFRIALVEQEIERAMERQALLAERRGYEERLERTVREQTAELRELNGELSRRVRELEARDRLVQFQLAHHTPAEACEEILSVAGELTGARTLAMFRVAGEAPRLSLAGFVRDGGTATVGDTGNEAEPEWTTGLRAAATRALQRRGPCRAGGRLGVAFRHGREILGALALEGSTSVLEASTNTLERVADQAALVLWKVRLLSQVESGDVDVEELLGLE